VTSGMGKLIPLTCQLLCGVGRKLTPVFDMLSLQSDDCGFS